MTSASEKNPPMDLNEFRKERQNKRITKCQESCMTPLTCRMMDRCILHEYYSSDDDEEDVE
jgi:hypothetical protein